MADFPWELVLALVGALVPIVAFLWEFAFVGRKQLGYRIQMNATATDVGREHAGAWQQLQLENDDETPLQNPSFVLLRIENTGTTNIDTHDYASPNESKVGIRFKFPGRTVAGLVVADLHKTLSTAHFSPDSGLNTRNVESPGQTEGVIELPRVPLNPGQHYKVLAVLESPDGGELAHPTVDGSIKTGLGSGEIKKTESFTGIPRWIVALIVALVAIASAEPFVLDQFSDKPAPLDCATGRLTVTGSTAFEPIVREAMAAYAKSCQGSGFQAEMTGSTNGLEQLNNSRSPDVVAFSDGLKTEVKGQKLPELIQRPVALQLFTLVANKNTGVEDLTLAQVKDVFGGRVGAWKDIGAKNDLPVRLVDRESSSGTRATLEQRVLGFSEPGENSTDCEQPKTDLRGQVTRCRQGDTTAVLNAVANTPGSIGYVELGAATDRQKTKQDVVKVRIDGQQSTLDTTDRGMFPFWQTEYAYTFSEPKSDSLAASFLRYLTNQVGMDIIRSHGHRPCADLQNPVRCRPS
ncbi:PstS family phosphate ABC transporter substrate-binding protein [Amycolatopsis sp. CA-230715]|uniref:PstS family phosphate ABC transporter substrate-binding protein n=1 Tax=Amycolatopsis sp. CA-230715 TaxID=2745196 RepID=UPI001C030ADB|nr:substrate-binding domain-containing protein [Amycolatopsis sp. CA-230715]QWF82992.1 hypothetical protein HUW46_06431 [Amycolatopsis sp. CA-230715]